MPARNEIQNIDLCLDGLRAQTGLSNRSLIIVVDNESQDGTAAAVEQCSAADPRIRLASAERVAGLAASIVFGGFLTLVLMPYFMISAPRLSSGAIWLLPPERWRSIEDLLPKIVPVWRRYLIGIYVVVFYTAVAAWIGFGPVFHLPNAVPLALTVGALELVRVIGPLASATTVGLVAIQQSGIWAAAFPVRFRHCAAPVDRQCRGPIVLGEAARIHPVVVIMSFVCGAILFGVVGLLIAVPIAVCIKVTLRQYYAEPIAAGEPSRDGSA